ncbi:MAG: hypothetical protein VB018_12315 [Lachnospiraceae bacterium]|nr:hypothetical protein [Lachnospiraceae bacterium]
MDIQAAIYEDGSMYITQNWKGSFEEGTESYIPINAPDYLTISGLTVSDQNGSYDTVSNWNIDWSFEKKARKCGIHTTPTDVKVEIRLADGTPITDEIADIWGFGFTGQVEFQNGGVIAYTTTPISTENHLTVLFALGKGILSPSRQYEGSFGEVREKALWGSDYDNTDSTVEEASAFDVIVAALLFIGLPIVLIILISKIKKKRAEKKRQKFAEKFGYFRNIPNEGNLSATYALGILFNECDEGAILATGMLRLIQLGCLLPVETQEIGLMGKTKETISLRMMGSQHDMMNEYDECLYTVLEGEAGSDAILQAEEQGNG